MKTNNEQSDYLEKRFEEFMEEKADYTWEGFGLFQDEILSFIEKEIKSELKLLRDEVIGEERTEGILGILGSEHRDGVINIGYNKKRQEIIDIFNKYLK